MTIDEFLDKYNKSIEFYEIEVLRYLYIKYGNDRPKKGCFNEEEWKDKKDQAIKALEDARNHPVSIMMEYIEEPKRGFRIEGNSLRETMSDPLHLGKMITVKACEVEKVCQEETIEEHTPTSVEIVEY